MSIDPKEWIAAARESVRLGRRALALQNLARAAEPASSDPAALDAIGTLYTLLELPARALPFLTSAVTRAPENLDYRYNLAMVQRMTGELAAAEDNLDRVLAARPLDGEAHHARSGLRRQSPDRNHVVQLNAALVHLRGRRAAIPATFALAKELEDLGEHARSFACLQSACRAIRATLRYDVGDDVGVLDALRDRHGRAAFTSSSGDGPPDQPIFILGLPRSGTTLVEQIVACHRGVVSAGETDAFQRVIIEAVGRLASGPVAKQQFVARSLQVDFGQLGASYLAAVHAYLDAPSRFIDKTPMNYLYAGLIHAALPRARFVALRRHPMDSCYAMYKTLFAAGYPFSYDLGDLGRYYLAWDKLMRHWRDALGDAWLDVGYEDLVAAPETVGRAIAAHCNLDWEPESLEFHSRRAATTSASAAQVREPVHTRSAGLWRAYSRELAPLAAFFAEQGLEIE